MTANYAEIAKHVTVNEEGIIWDIAVNETACGVTVTGISMFVEVGDNAADGDLVVAWDATGLENTGGGDMGPALMRGWEDEVGEVMGRFYWKKEFNARLKQLLMAAGFSEAAASVSGSEWGMQDEERASYDANGVAEEIREAVAKLQLA